MYGQLYSSQHAFRTLQAPFTFCVLSLKHTGLMPAVIHRLLLDEHVGKNTASVLAGCDSACDFNSYCSRKTCAFSHFIFFFFFNKNLLKVQNMAYENFLKLPRCQDSWNVATEHVKTANSINGMLIN